MKKYDFNKLTNILEVVKLRESFDLTDPLWQKAEIRLRELLTKKYGDEQALCLKSTFIPNYIKPGFVSIKDIRMADGTTLDFINDLARIAVFIPRAYCEYNPLYKQIIPYIIGVTPDNKVFTMQRIEGDDRLVGKLSIGIGGHINIEDEGTNTIMAGAKREIAEEVDGVSNKAFFTFEGFLYDPSDLVGLDHIGFVFFLRLSDDTISIKEVDKLKGFLSTTEELSTKYVLMENWTQIVFDNLLKK